MNDYIVDLEEIFVGLYQIHGLITWRFKTQQTCLFVGMDFAAIYMSQRKKNLLEDHSFVADYKLE